MMSTQRANQRALLGTRDQREQIKISSSEDAKTRHRDWSVLITCAKYGFLIAYYIHP